MQDYEFVTLDVFSAERFGGNPLAVLPDARGLETAQMQAIAAEFNLSETTFVLPPDDPLHTARVRIFTPRMELPFAGHPSVGTATVLARRMDAVPEHLVLEMASGLVRAHVLRGADGAVAGSRIAAPRALSVGVAVPTELAASLASLDAGDVATMAHEPLVASMGVDFIVAEVADAATLARATPDISAFRAAGRRSPELPMGLLVYARLDGDARRLRLRMFAPLLGIAEDPATGSAAVALGGLLTAIAPGGDVSLAFDMEQGIELGRPSRMLVTVRKSADGPIEASVGGDCVQVMRGTIAL